MKSSPSLKSILAEFIAGLKPPAQYVEALRANERVRFIRLSRTEAGLEPAESMI
ncbi:MAG: hypothetical protein IT312_04325 [Anaerolineales bacterium]|nr:hypothetical protein [Anaerolineales bacterium]